MLIILFVWSSWTAIAKGVTNTKRLHTIPCSNCQYFTGDYRLKCTAQPSIALSEAAINCPDYRPDSLTLTDS